MPPFSPRCKAPRLPDLRFSGVTDLRAETYRDPARTSWVTGQAARDIHGSAHATQLLLVCLALASRSQLVESKKASASVHQSHRLSERSQALQEEAVQKHLCKLSGQRAQPPKRGRTLDVASALRPNQVPAARQAAGSRARQRHRDDEVLVFGTFTEASMCLVLAGNTENTHTHTHAHTHAHTHTHRERQRQRQDRPSAKLLGKAHQAESSSRRGRSLGFRLAKRSFLRIEARGQGAQKQILAQELWEKAQRRGDKRTRDESSPAGPGLRNQPSQLPVADCTPALGSLGPLGVSPKKRGPWVFQVWGLQSGLRA